MASPQRLLAASTHLPPAVSSQLPPVASLRPAPVASLQLPLVERTVDQ
ncbi:hypothetical protein OG588_04645 [Streptomyces prunicolor]|nr:hypothetical protein OG588_04645 [Streptomyces prunicolor]